MMEKRISLLHVEDDPEYAKFFSMFLQKLASKDDGVSLDITAARSTEDAISLCKAHNYDCIVSGHKRGDESGRGLMEAVRQIHPDIPVIFLMGQEDGQVARKAFAQGASDYLSNDREIIPYERIFHSIINQAP